MVVRKCDVCGTEIDLRLYKVKKNFIPAIPKKWYEIDICVDCMGKIRQLAGLNKKFKKVKDRPSADICCSCMDRQIDDSNVIDCDTECPFKKEKGE